MVVALRLNAMNAVLHENREPTGRNLSKIKPT